MTQAGVAALLRDRAAGVAQRAERAARDAERSGSGGSSREPTYFYNPTTQHYTYSVDGSSPGGDWQNLGTTQPAGYIGGQARGVATDVDKELEMLSGGSRPQQLEQGAYRYDAPSGKLQKETVTNIQGRGEKAFTLREAQFIQERYISKGMSPYTYTAGNIGLSIGAARKFNELEMEDDAARRSPAIFTGGELYPTTRNEPTIPSEFLGEMRPDTRGTISPEYSFLLEFPTELAYNESPTKTTAYQRFLYKVGQEWEESSTTQNIYLAGMGVLSAIGSSEKIKENAITPFLEGAAITTALFIAPEFTIPAYIGSVGLAAYQAPAMMKGYGEAQLSGQGSEYLATLGVQAASAFAGGYSVQLGSMAMTYLKARTPSSFPGDYEWNARYTTTTNLENYERTLLNSRFISESLKNEVLTHAYIKQQLESGFSAFSLLSSEQQRYFGIAEGNQLGRQAHYIDFFNLADTAQKIGIDAQEGYISVNDLNAFYKGPSETTTRTYSVDMLNDNIVATSDRPPSSQLYPRSFRYDTAGAGWSNINLDVDYYAGTVWAGGEYQTLLEIPQEGASPYANRYGGGGGGRLQPPRLDLPFTTYLSNPRNARVTVDITGSEVFAGYPPSQYIATTEITPGGQTILGIEPFTRVDTKIMRLISEPTFGIYAETESTLLVGGDALRPRPFTMPTVTEPIGRPTDLFDFIDGGRPNRFQMWFNRAEMPYERAPARTTVTNPPLLLNPPATAEPLLLEYNPPSLWRRITSGLDKIESPVFSPSSKRIYFEMFPGSSLLIETAERYFTGLNPKLGAYKYVPEDEFIPLGGGNLFPKKLNLQQLGENLGRNPFWSFGVTSSITMTGAGIKSLSSGLYGPSTKTYLTPALYQAQLRDQQLKQGSAQRQGSMLDLSLAQGQEQRQEQELIIVPILDVPQLPKTPKINLHRPYVPIDIEPDQVFPLIRSPRRDERRAPSLLRMSPQAISPATRKGYSLEPFAGLYSVSLSQFAFGKGTYPSLSVGSKKKFKLRVMGGAPDFPTVELEKNFKVGRKGKWAF